MLQNRFPWGDTLEEPTGHNSLAGPGYLLYPRMPAVHSMRYRWVGQGFKRPLLEWMERKEKESLTAIVSAPILSFSFPCTDTHVVAFSPTPPNPSREYSLTAGSIVSPERRVPPHPFHYLPILVGIIEKRKHQQIERRASTWTPRDLLGVKRKKVRQDGWM